jgi:nicotinamide mononucleotide transporter
VDLVLTPFHTTAVVAFGAATSWGEVIGFVTGALCVWLVAAQNPWNGGLTGLHQRRIWRYNP